MAWSGIWFECHAETGSAHSPEWFEGLVEPVIYPYAHTFVESEEERLRKSVDPAVVRRLGDKFSVFYSIRHDGGMSSLDQQGCRILGWLFSHFSRDSGSTISSRFSEIPIVIHETNPQKAAALGNALTLLRFLAASEDQAIAKILIHPWDPMRGNPRLAAQDYEQRVIEFLHGEIFYPEDVDLFDVLERRDLKEHRELGPCCQTQIGFIGPLLEWIDECWPKTPEQRAELRRQLTNSLADEASFIRAQKSKNAPKKSAMETFR